MSQQTASTGQNDSSSVWGSGLLGTITGLAGTGADIYATVTGRRQTVTAPAQTPTAAPAPTSTWQKYLPWIGGGVALLVVAMLVFRKN